MQRKELDFVNYTVLHNQQLDIGIRNISIIDYVFMCDF